MENILERKYIEMREVPKAEYLEFIKTHQTVTIEDVELEIGKNWEIKNYQPTNFEPEKTTVWSFPERGKWATHYLNAKYRGNWAPQVARNLILKYSKPGEVVLDAFLGSGTTLIECKLLGRNGIGIDINYDAIMLSWDRLNFSYKPKKETQLVEWIKRPNSTIDEDKNEFSWKDSEITLFMGDARNLDKLENESIDLIATHPPYASIISYTKRQKIDNGDLSKVTSIAEFVDEMKVVAKEFYRVLKPGRHCAILIGDTRRHKHFVPIAVRVMQAFLDVGFILKENIIKIQHHMKGTIPWRKDVLDFHLIAHENLFVFRKPEKEEKIEKFKESMKWW